MAGNPLDTLGDILGDDTRKLTKKSSGDQYAQAASDTATDAAPTTSADAAPRGKGGVDVQGLIEKSREADKAQKRLDEIAKQEAASKKAASAAKERAMAQRVGEIRAKYEPELQKPAPEFTPSRENIANIGSLGGMLMVLGAMSGGKGLVSATGAMNAMAGMLKGYQDGRKEVFDREKASFEQNMKSWQANRQVIKETFDRAIKYAPYDIQKATNEAVAKLRSVGATTLATYTAQSGVPAAAETFRQADAQFQQLAMPIVNQLTAAQFPLGVTQTRGPAAETLPQQPMTKEQAKDVKTAFEKAKEEAKILKDFSEKPEKPREDTTRYKVEVDGERTYMTRPEYDEAKKAGRKIRFVEKIEPEPETGPEEAAKLKATASTQNRFDAINDGVDYMTSIVKQSNNQALKAEWDKSGLSKMFSEPLNDTWYARAVSQIVKSNMSPEAQTLAENIMQARNAYYLQTSGKTVTGNEAMRNFGAVIQPTDNWDSLMRKAKYSLRQTLEKGEDIVEGYDFPPSMVNSFKAKKLTAMSYLGETDQPGADERQKAIDWVRKNPNDPRVPAIKQRFGI